MAFWTRGEACDDRNRLNGDGCDWRCRVGDGDPRPAPDPSVPDYAPAGEPVSLEGVSGNVPRGDNLPLAWTGTEFATAFPSGSDEDPEIRFHRFEPDGTPVDADWAYGVRAPFVQVDLAWTGDGFGLFYTDMTNGLFLQRLEPSGKPIGSPMLVEADPRCRAPAADWTGEQFVVAWMVETSARAGMGVCTGLGEPPDLVRMRLVGPDGSVLGGSEPLLVDDYANGPPDVVAGPGGFGVTNLVRAVHGDLDCSLRFTWVSAEWSVRGHARRRSQSLRRRWRWPRHGFLPVVPDG